VALCVARVSGVDQTVPPRYPPPPPPSRCECGGTAQHARQRQLEFSQLVCELPLALAALPLDESADEHRVRVPVGPVAAFEVGVFMRELAFAVR
jgi:hypothetical protein